MVKESIVYYKKYKAEERRSMSKKYFMMILVMTCSFLFVGCIPGDGHNTALNPAGFFWGIWHGWMAPLSLIISIFVDKITIYESWNSGFWYDFGFYIAVISGFGGLSLSRKRKKHTTDRDKY